MNAPSNEPLTPIGERRRQAMLTELTGYMERVHHGRRLRRRGAALALFLALSAVIAVAAMSGRNGPPPKTIAKHDPIESIPPRRSARLPGHRCDRQERPRHRRQVPGHGHDLLEHPRGTSG